jgi:tetratricopeptide (TPR) repeat protein
VTLLLALVMSLAGEELEQVEVEAVQLPTEQGIARIDGWIAENPTSTQLPRALLWEAQQRIAQQRFDPARALLDRALRSNPDPELALDLGLTQADVSALEGHFDEAARAYESLPAPPGSRWAMQASMRAAEMRGEAWRHRAMFGLAGLSGLIIALRVVRRRKELWPPPEEVTWSAPVLLTLCLAALSRPPTERMAVLMVCLGGLGLLWLTGAALRTRVLGRGARVAELGLAVFLSGSLLFCAIVVSGLWARVADTFAGGVD